eukprot:gnl/MRDRNA2_/MRDRNA2_549818_c0_seq1.p1 gnl/MRDRNA2_/MRDRNA2_549818_c0~~gnl/MRDRNA2_/MRDRNA2_549818_c0_seq1.p1  ORF type:complete len:106 (+),score=14.09 gnl/MRDRNA2_/MRDRNA2_549818_c0_seq1:46-363(+)
MAHITFASSCGLKLLKFCCTLVKTAKNDVARWHEVANAHAELLSSCALKSHKQGSIAFVSAKSSDTSDQPAAANAHAVLLRCCALKLRRRNTATLSIATNSTTSG